MKKREKEVIKSGEDSSRSTPIVYSDVERLIVSVRGQPVIVDADVAKLYGVATKRVNEAVRNNPEKFPADYMFELDRDESSILRSKISSLEHDRRGKGRHSKYNFKAFTEKGLVFCGHIHTGQHGGVDFAGSRIYNISRLDERYEIAYEPTWVKV